MDWTGLGSCSEAKIRRWIDPEGQLEFMAHLSYLPVGNGGCHFKGTLTSSSTKVFKECLETLNNPDHGGILQG